MKVVITVKEVNPEFDHEHAEREHGGKESEDNILYNWEDEFAISGEVKDFKIRNNVPYDLVVQQDDDTATYTIEGMMVADAHLDSGSITSCAFSRSIVKDTKKVVNKNGDIHFYVFLKGGREIVTPVTGIYIDRKNFPAELPLPEEEDISGDEEE